MRRKQRFTNKNRNSSGSFFNKIVSVITIIKLELLFAILALILSLGQYFQSSITTRINITETWRNGYTSENRNRVARFRYFYKKCKERFGEKIAKESIKKIIDPKQLFGNNITSAEFIDQFIKDLVQDEIEAIKRKEVETIKDESRIKQIVAEEVKKILEKKDGKTSNGSTNGGMESNQADQTENNIRELTKDEYIEIILKYRNAIIETLNTSEAVKAVIRSKPLPFRINIFYKDTLEGRYNDIIEELKTDLIDFIEVYRDTVPPRETEAWFVLTSEESDLNDVVNVILYFLVFSSALTLIYLVKIRMQKRGLLQENAK